MSDAPSLRKARGAFFTPPVLADFITSWAIRTPSDTVLEPSCGEAAFLLSAAQRLRALGGQPDKSLLYGTEVHAPSAAAARDALRDAGGADVDITVGDFLTQQPARQYSAVVGNPPYVRYQDFSGAARAAGQRAALAAGVRLNGLASAWAPFVVHATQFVEPGGRLGLVLPAELLTVGYASGVREYLLRRFSDVRLVVFEERVFPGVLEEVVLLLAGGDGSTDHFKLHQARDSSDLDDASRLAWTSTTPEQKAKWMPALLDASSFDTYRELTTDGAFAALAQEWGKTGLGAVTGNNRWFTLTADKADDLQLSGDELLAISPPGSRHLRSLALDTAAWQRLVDDGKPTYLFYPGDRPSVAAQSYIDAGHDDGIHTAYKCRVRTPWWRVPLAPLPDLFLTYMNHVAPQLATNSAGVRHLNSVHGVVLHDEHRDLGRELLPIAALNSVTLLGAEMVGRAYGGGLLKLEPREADRWPMPAPGLVRAAQAELDAVRDSVTLSLRRGDVLRAVELVDEALLAEHTGLTSRELRALRTGRELMFQRRVARGRDPSQ